MNGDQHGGDNCQAEHGNQKYNRLEYDFVTVMFTHGLSR